MTEPVTFVPGTTDRSLRLSKNFRLYEFDCRDGTEVPDELVEPLAAFVQGVPQLVRDFWDSPVTVTSGYRTRRYNDSLPGTSKGSYHVYDDRPGKFAVDLVVQGVSPIQVYHSILGMIRLGIVPDGGLHVYKNFVHYDNGHARRWA